MMFVVLLGEMTEDPLLVTFLRITLFVPILLFNKYICLNLCTGNGKRVSLMIILFALNVLRERIMERFKRSEQSKSWR